MGDIVIERDKAIDETTERLERLLREARKDEAELKRTLEMRRLRRLVEAKRLK